MWVHFIIFMTAFGTVLVWKAGWLRLDGIADKESLRLFLIVAVCGNLAGMAMTLTNGNSEIYQKGHRIEKSEDGAYTEELQVSVGDGKPEKVAVQIPEKETEETEAENAQVKQSPEEMRQKELKEVIEQYNREKQDPDYYYLPDSWDGQTLKWQKPGESTGTLLAALALFAAVVLMLKKDERTAGRDGQTGRTASDGLSVADHEVYTSDPGRYDGSQSISEDQFRLSEKLSERRTICI